MPHQSLKLGPPSNDTVELDWKGMWKSFTVSAEGRELGRMNGQAELRQGGSWTLSDGATLEVRLEGNAMGTVLSVKRNGVPLEGSAGAPETRVNGAAGIAFFIGGLNILLGGLAELADVAFLRNLGVGYLSIGFGVVFLALGFAIRKASITALIVAIVLFALDAVLGIYSTLDAGAQPPIGGIIFRVFLLIPMIQAIGPARELRASAKSG